MLVIKAEAVRLMQIGKQAHRTKLGNRRPSALRDDCDPALSCLVDPPRSRQRATMKCGKKP